MEYEAKYITEDIKLSCYEDKFFKSDIMFEHHMLIWFISGETKIVQADATYTFKKGDIFLIPRNQLATIINYPRDGQPHKTVVMHLSTARLRHFYASIAVKPKAIESQKIYHFSNHPLLESCLSSLIPYFEIKELPADIASLKITEAIRILRAIDKEIDNLLINFEEPGKIDLVSYMDNMAIPLRNGLVSSAIGLVQIHLTSSKMKNDHACEDKESSPAEAGIKIASLRPGTLSFRH